MCLKICVKTSVLEFLEELTTPPPPPRPASARLVNGFLLGEVPTWRVEICVI